MLRKLPVPDLVLPGHPNSSSVPQSPHLAPKDWAAILDEGIAEMQQLVARYEEDGASFLDGHPKRLLPDVYYLGDFQGFAVYGFFASSKFFVVNAPGGPGPGDLGLADFLKTRLRELGRPPAEPTAVLLTSCGERETAGLKELVERSGSQVVVSPAGGAVVKQLCPSNTTVVSSLDLADKGWFPVTPIELGGYGVAPIAYLISLADKKVLFSGTIPAGIDENPPDELLAELTKSRPNALAFNASLQRLAKLKPDLWLPAVPYHGQNANLYGSEWVDKLDKNRRAASFALQAPKPRQSPKP
jgi:glyoxylase-like metal-dependent hydrolase (beta-lactamase superfamily II)